MEAADLTTPLGRLVPATLWPDLTPGQVTRRLEGFLEAAALETDLTGLSTQTLRDRATKIWIELRVKSELLDELILTPSSAAFVDEGSGSYLAEQIRMLQQQVAALELELTGVLDEDTVEDEGAYQPFKSYR